MLARQRQDLSKALSVPAEKSFGTLENHCSFSVCTWSDFTLLLSWFLYMSLLRREVKGLKRLVWSFAEWTGIERDWAHSLPNATQAASGKAGSRGVVAGDHSTLCSASASIHGRNTLLHGCSEREWKGNLLGAARNVLGCPQAEKVQL